MFCAELSESFINYDLTANEDLYVSDIYISYGADWARENYSLTEAFVNFNISNFEKQNAS